jgi:hypothetical protein
MIRRRSPGERQAWLEKESALAARLSEAAEELAKAGFDDGERLNARAVLFTSASALRMHQFGSGS